MFIKSTTREVRRGGHLLFFDAGILVDVGGCDKLTP